MSTLLSIFVDRYINLFGQVQPRVVQLLIFISSQMEKNSTILSHIRKGNVVMWKGNVVEIPEISYSDLIEFIQKRREEYGKKDNKEFEIDDKISTSSKEFEDLSKELSDYKHKFEQLEKDYSKLRNEQPEHYDQAILKRKITFLEESNRAYLEEVESMKFANQDRKLNMQELKEKLHVMRQEVEMTKYQASLAEKKHEACRGKLERRIEKLKRRLESEENHSQKIKKEKSILQKKVDTGSFNDSGLEG